MTSATQNGNLGRLYELGEKEVIRHEKLRQTTFSD